MTASSQIKCYCAEYVLWNQATTHSSGSIFPIKTQTRREKQSG